MVAPLSSGRVGSISYDTAHESDPALSAEEARYALRCLWAVVGGGRVYQGPAHIRIRAASKTAYQEWRRAPAGALTSVRAAAVLPKGAPALSAEQLPAIVAGRPAPPWERLEDGSVVVNLDVAAFTFFMLSRVEERDGQRDERDRFPARESVAFRHGFLDRPAVDQWALVLRAWTSALDPAWQPAPARFRTLISHDVDAILRYSRWRDVLTAAAGSLVRRGHVRGAARRTLQGIRALRDWHFDPYYRGLQRLMATAESSGLRDAFYFKTSAAGPFDTGYRVADGAGFEMLREVTQRGHAIGFHPGYDTYLDPDLLHAEKQALESALGTGVEGGRQHNLRFRVPDTWLHWESVGLRYDSTLGYAEQAGFRCGTCHPYPVFDCVAGRELRLIEVPLIVMETTLFSSRYEGLAEGAARRRIADLVNRCAEVGGVFTLLWHNTSFEGAYERWSAIYESVITQIARLEPQPWTPATQVMLSD